MPEESPKLYGNIKSCPAKDVRKLVDECDFEFETERGIIVYEVHCKNSVWELDAGAPIVFILKEKEGAIIDVMDMSLL